MSVIDNEGNPLSGVDINGYRVDKVQEIVTMMENFLSDVVLRVNSFGDTGGGETGGDVSLPFYTKSEIQEILSAYAVMGQLSELIASLVSGRITELQNTGELYGSDSPEIITLQDRLENIHKLCYGYGFDGVIDLNYVPYNISIENMKNAVNGYTSSISALNGVVFTQDGEQTQVLNLALKDDVGDKDLLETTNKSSLVDAINELESRQVDANAIFPSGATSGQVLTYNGTSRVWADVDAKKILTKTIDISSFTGKNGQVLKYNEPANKFELGVVESGDTLPTGGVAGQVLSTDGNGNESWVDMSVGITLPDFMAQDEDGIKVYNDTSKTEVASVLGRAVVSSAVNVLSYVPDLSSNVSSDGTVTASEVFSVDYDSWKAFDSDSESFWSTSLPTGWIAYEFVTPRAVNKYSIKARSDVSDGAPNTWTFSAFDGTNWIVLDSQTGITFSNGQTIEFSITNNTDYSMYRLDVTANNGRETLNIAKIELGEVRDAIYSYGVTSSQVKLVAPNGSVWGLSVSNTGELSTVLIS